MTEAIELSLKEDGAWSGLSYESEIMPSTGRFRRLKGCYHSPDGTELVRFPGTAIVAEPGYCERKSGTLSTDGGGQAVFTGQAGPSDFGLLLMEESAVKARHAFIRNTDGVNNLPSGWYLGRVVNATREFRTLVASAGANAGDDDSIYLSRIQQRDAGNALHVHDLKNVFGYCAIAFDANLFFSATHAAAPADLLGFFHQQHAALLISNYLFNFDAPVEVESWSYVPSVPLAELLNDVRVARDTTINYRNTPTLTTAGILYALMPWYRRAQLESFDGHLIAAVPGYGCCFHWDHSVAAREVQGRPPSLGWMGFLDALGIPKAVIHRLVVVGDVNGTIPNNQWVAVQICYYNSRTGRYGLPSEKLTIQNTSGGPAKLSIECLHPRWVMRETDADTVVIWGSTPAAVVDEVLLTSRRYTVVSRSLSVATAQLALNAYLVAPALDPDSNDQRLGQLVPPYLNQMPMGATIAVALKGHLMLAGQMQGDAISDHGHVAVRTVNDPAQEKVAVVDPVNLCAHGLPTSYQGNVDGLSTRFGLNRLQSVVGYGAAAPLPYYPWWKYRQGLTSGVAAFMSQGRIVKSHVQFTTKERPGECPAPQRFIADRLAGRDVVAAGRFGDTLIFCTEHETYGISINQSPLGAEPTLLSDKYGAISPVMVQTAIGLEWLSHLGPVTFSGGVTRVHRQVEKLFGRGVFQDDGTLIELPFLRDSRGLMMNHRAVHDSERRLVYHFLRRDKHNSDHATAGYNYKIESYAAGPPNQLILETNQLGPYCPLTAHLPCVIRRAGVVIYAGSASFVDYDVTVGVKMTLLPAPATAPLQGDVLQVMIDAAKSKVSADTVLVHAYMSDAFALQEWAGDPAWQAAGDCMFSDGVMRPVFITENKHAVKTPTTPAVYEVELKGAIFGVDDRWADRLKEPVVVTATAPPIATGGTFFFQAVGTEFRDLLRGEWFTTKATHYEAFIRSGTTDYRGNYELKWWGRVDLIASSGIGSPTKHDRIRIVLDPTKPTPAWVAGDVMEIGVTHIELETLKLNVPDLGDARDQRKYGQSVRGLVLEHTFRRESNVQQQPVVGWAYAEGYGDGAWVKLHAETWGHPLQPTTQVSRVVGGMAVGRENAIRLAIISNAQVRLKDLRLDLGTGGR